ncbi:hypothetical protein [Cellulomonas xylanilytica]|uniref:Uncharacterized protein n=1 Tax=Cellulomonas xylanilytica TaxID=233583 RepID=A0A510V1M4_9CELL|nr:hypothetical protein [Cellulomonas xylanilytica]GEK20696.1 hypothetical protein CXY01_12160 [Cellulomonas xylanilytica]
MDPARQLIDLRRRPEALVAAVGVVVLALTYAMVVWNNVLESRSSAGYGWPEDQVVLVTVRWTLTVVLWCSVVWVASRRQARLGHPWRVPAIALGVIALWVVTSWRSDYQQGLLAIAVPWPGPVPGVVSLVLPENDLLSSWAVRPGIVTPFLLAVAVTVVARAAARRATADGRPDPSVPSSAATRTALVVLAPLTVAAVVTATSLLWSRSRREGTSDLVLSMLVDPGARLAVAITAALLLGGTGRVGRVLTGLVTVVAVGPLVLTWWAGAPGEKLAGAALGALAVCLAAAVHPVSTALSRTDRVEPGSAPIDAQPVRGRQVGPAHTAPDLVQPVVGLVLALVVAAFAMLAAEPVLRAAAGDHADSVTRGMVWDEGSGWAWSIGVCLLLTWSATRGLARRGSRFTAAPLVLALAIVVNDALVWHTNELDVRTPLSTAIDPGRYYGSPSWAFTAAAPFVVGALLVVAWWLGRRVAPVAPPPRSALVPAAIVVALPALAAAALVVAVLAVNAGDVITDAQRGQLLTLALMALLVLGFPLLASGGGRAGVVATLAGVLAIPGIMTIPLSSAPLAALAVTGSSLSLVPLARAIARARSRRATTTREIAPVPDRAPAAR